MIFVVGSISTIIDISHELGMRGLRWVWIMQNEGKKASYGWDPPRKGRPSHRSYLSRALFEGVEEPMRLVEAFKGAGRG